MRSPLVRVVPIAALACALLAQPAPVRATTVVAVTVEELARRADEVVIATPRAQVSRWVGQTIVTDVVLEVQTAVRGALVGGARVTLQLPGGSVGRIGQMIPGVPSPQIDTPYVFFLSRAASAPGTFYLAHLTAAVLSLAPVPGGGGAITVLPVAEGLITRGASTAPVRATAARPTVMTRDGVALEVLVPALRGTP